MIIPPIHIDMSETLEEFDIPPGLGAEIADNVIKRLTYRFYEIWSVTAGRELHSSRQQYITSLQVLDEGKMKGAVILHGAYPNMIESGASPFDMKAGFMRSGKVKMTKDGGWYLTIPLRAASSGALGESSIFSGVLPKEVHEEAKKLIGKKSEFKGSIKLGETLSKMSIPEKYRESAKRPAVSDPFTKKTFDEYVHKTSIYEGLGKSSKTYQNATQSMFNSFRRVSSKSDPNSWIHSGLRARQLAEKALSGFDISHEVDISVDSQLSNLGYS